MPRTSGMTGQFRDRRGDLEQLEPVQLVVAGPRAFMNCVLPNALQRHWANNNSPTLLPISARSGPLNEIEKSSDQP